MPPPRRKDNANSTKAKGSFSEYSWRSEIEGLSLNDDRWSCVIAMMVETRPEHARYLDLFAEAAEEETRPAVFSLSYEKLIRCVKLARKSDLHQGICQFANGKIESEGEGAMGPWLICRLIKFFVNRAKARSLEILRSRARMEGEITKEIENLGPNTDAKSKRGSGDGKSFDKMNTRLRKRGEEWRDRVRIDDAPIGGADMYVVLSGFRDLNLCEELLDAGVPLTAIFKVLRPGEQLDVDEAQLYTFWSGLEETLKDPKAAARFSQVVFQTFCPPQIKDADKTDAYQRISTLMYDLSDIKRQHGAYIREMKLQTGLEEERIETRATETYDSIMREVPEECITVAIVLDAILSQIDGSKTGKETFDGGKTTPETFGSRIDDLNNKFGVFDVSKPVNPPGNSDLRLILHGDNLRRNTHHCASKIAGDFGLRVLREFAEFVIWRNAPVLTVERIKMHEENVAKISDCFDGDMDDLTTGHYLHLSVFDKLINGINPRGNVARKTPPPSLEELAKTQTIASDKSPGESLPTSSFQRDSTTAECGKETEDTFDCPELFSLIDTTREMLPTVSESFPLENRGTLDLEEFDTVQLLSSGVFPQLFFACCKEFDDFETGYFAPTDSVLVLFRKNAGVSGREYAASIRTPVCLRDFDKFVITEETEWVKRESERHDKRLAALSKSRDEKPGDDSPLASLYTDADFVLQDSIKGAAEVGKQKPRQGPIDETETVEELPLGTKRRSKETAATNPERAKIPKRKGTVINPSRKGEEGALPPQKNTESIHLFLAEEKEEEDVDPRPPLIGYDIANHRVQVSGFSSEFLSTDGTSVKVNREEWTCGSRPKLQIIIELLGNELVSQIVAGEEYAGFHLATTNGILMGFSAALLDGKERAASPGSGQSITKRNYQRGKIGRESETAEMAVDPGFRASWPSGLVVETLPGDGPSEPFYIKQSYLSKGPECTGISRETGRVFLRDGTVAVFLDDDSVRVMHSNGRIVTCNGFDKDAIKKMRILEPDGKLYEIFDGERTREIGQELVRTASDYEVGERFTRRSDGTDILINSDGLLAVCFPDGTRITTGYVIAEDPVSCEWSEEEFRKFYSTADLESIETTLNEDGFVSIFLTICIEQKNYATVGYDKSKIDCTLSMPGDVVVQISRDSLFSVSVGGGVSLKVKKNEVEFAGKMKKSSSRSVFSLDNPSGSSSAKTSPFLETTDSFGNIFSANFDGETSYKKFRDSSDPAEENSNDSKDYRLFAVRRDLSAHEYLHSSEREAQESDKTASIFFRQVDEASNQKLCTTLTGLNPITASQAWLQPYRVKSIRPTNEDRRDLLRSTYSVPWNCLIPYGKNGRGIRESSWYLPLKNIPDLPRVEVIFARTTQTIKNRGENVAEKLRKAVDCCRIKKSMNGSHEYRGSVARKSLGRKECEIRDWLSDFALGRKTTFDKALYSDGLRESRATLGSRISKRENSGPKNEEESDKAEIEWYKTCLRDHTVPLYFAGVSGACFTWVLECVNKIGEEGRDFGE